MNFHCIDQIVITELSGWREEFYVSIHRNGTSLLRKRKGPTGIPQMVQSFEAEDLFLKILSMLRNKSIPSDGFLKTIDGKRSIMILFLTKPEHDLPILDSSKITSEVYCPEKIMELVDHFFNQKKEKKTRPVYPSSPHFRWHPLWYEVTDKQDH